MTVENPSTSIAPNHRRRSAVHFVLAVLVLVAEFVHGYLHEDVYRDATLLGVDTESQSQVLTVSSVPLRVEISTSTRRDFTILVYHKIPTDEEYNAKKTNDRFTVKQSVFEEQIKYLLDEGYTFMTLDQALKSMHHNISDKKIVVITFDDGWRTQFDVALPILNKLQIPATFYLYTDVIGSRLFMSWSDIDVLVKDGMEIGDHTKSHPKLGRIDSSRYVSELGLSKRILEKHTGVSVTNFAYPYGNYNNQVIDALKKEGYSSARTSNFGKDAHPENPYELKAVYGPTAIEEFKKIFGVSVRAQATSTNATVKRNGVR